MLLNNYFLGLISKLNYIKYIRKMIIVSFILFNRPIPLHVNDLNSEIILYTTEFLVMYISTQNHKSIGRNLDKYL